MLLRMEVDSVQVQGPITNYGSEVLENLEEGAEDRESVCFQPAGSCNVTKGNHGPRVLVVLLFDGIGAVMAAIARLPCRVVG